MSAIFLHTGLHIVLAAEQGLQDDIEDSRPKEVHVDTNLLQVLAEGSQTPFVSKVVLLIVLVLNELLILLVDRVVGQVHELVVFVDLLSVGL